MTSNLNLMALESFDCDSDPSNIGLRWERWKRGFEIYLQAAEIQDPVKKRATLLHTGGLGVQEIFHNLPEADIDGDIDEFQAALKKLDAYFSPKQSRVYERHLFHLMRQEADEKFEKFLIRLRKQAAKCQFANKEESLIDQIVEKCSSKELRKKILKGGDNVTLEDIIIEANTLESVNRQLEEFDRKLPSGPSNYINDAEKSHNSDSVNKIQIKLASQNKKCLKCGKNTHTSRDPKCLTRYAKCHNCGVLGHFIKCCWKIKSRKRPFYQDRRETVDSTPSKKSTLKEDVHYVFRIDGDCIIECDIGGVTSKLLIDSGSKCNLLTEDTWIHLKASGVQVGDEKRNPDKIFLPYGSNQPLTVIISFTCLVKIQNKHEHATFYVIRNGTKDLLGKETAIALGVLRVGLEVVNSVNFVPFPKFKDVLVEIPIDINVKPVCQPCRRIPIPLEDKVSKKLQELMDADIIEEVREPSNWVSPIVPILKENGDVRLCVDMRRANEAIMRENHPLPTMDQLLPRFKKARVFSRLDIKDAFHQIEIHPDSRHITTFITSKGMYRYKRLMFGISCAPEIFQKTLERILLGCEGTVNFIDDIVVYGANQNEHNNRLKHTLSVLSQNSILLNKDKCKFSITKMEFLGHELTPEGVKPLKKYVESIQSFRTPSTIEELQSFLGLVNYVGKWIPNLATLTEPLRQLLRDKPGKKAALTNCWSTEQTGSFQKLKTQLTNIKTLGYYDASDKTQVIADASPVGLGAVLVQIDVNGPRVIAYGSKSLTACEKRYCQTEKEALALVWAVEHFKIYLYGKEFELVSDHKPLEVIFGKNSKPCARIERWVLRLQSFRYKIIYRPGKNNIADSISRLCVNTNATGSTNEHDFIHQIIEYYRPTAVSLYEIEKSSGEDQELKKVWAGLYEQSWDPSVKCYKIFSTELCFHERVLLRGNKIVIPTNLRNRVLEAAHEGHPGIVAMTQRLRSKVWWPKIDKEAEEMVKACKSCTLVSAPNPPNPMKRRELPTAPWIDVAMDLLGPLPSGDNILVLIDYYSRYKEIKITRIVTATEIIKILKEIFSRLGYPVTVLADNGRQFTSEELKSYFHECGIKLYNSTPYWPQQNGEVERQNRSILKRLRISQIEKRNWKEDLYYYSMMYNSTPNQTTGKSPSELFYGRQFRDKIPSHVDVENKDIDEETRDRDKIHKQTGKEYSDHRRKAVDHNIEEGDKVFVKNMVKHNKLTPNFSPATHTVTKANESGDLNVRNDETGQEYRRNVVHLKKIGGEWSVQKTESNLDEADKESFIQ